MSTRDDAGTPRRFRGPWLWVAALLVVGASALSLVAARAGVMGREPARGSPAAADRAAPGDNEAAVSDDPTASDGDPAATGGGDGCHFWVAPPPTGDDEAPGTRTQPWATLGHAVTAVPDDGCTVSFAPGIYRGYHNPERRFDTETTFRSATPYTAVLENDDTVLDIDGGRNITIEGFELRHTGTDAPRYSFLAIVDRRDDTWSRDIVFRNNIFHDSYGDDLLKIHNGVRGATVEGNLFYNQGGNEQAIDVNSVADVDIHDNIFFMDYDGSGRSPGEPAKHFIIVKDSGAADDGLDGSRSVAIRRNVFLNWGGGQEQFIKIGNDGKPYYEARNVLVENNLLLGNASTPADAAFGVRGARDVVFNNNTVVGDLPASSFAYRIHLKDANPRNDDIRFTNNIWSDPTGTMGSDGDGGDNEFSDGDPDDVSDLVNDTNLYWNGGEKIPDGLVHPLLADPHAIVADPLVGADQGDVVLPRWEGDGFASGGTSIRDEFLRLVQTFGAPPAASPAVDAADPETAATDDILGRSRTTPDLGAFESSGRSEQ